MVSARSRLRRWLRRVVLLAVAGAVGAVGATVASVVWVRAEAGEHIYAGVDDALRAA